MIIAGGHAFMLEVSIPDDLKSIAESWANEFNAEVSENPHVTVLFVGRNLPSEITLLMHDAAERLIHLCPESLTLQGRLEMFGYRYDHLVAIIKPNEKLQRLRDEFLKEFRTKGDFKYVSHVTLAKATRNHPPPRIIRQEQELKTTYLVVKSGDSYCRRSL